jgi:lactate dehydrogenase-like 2-hydroxyacid dehydrogenase
LYVYEERIPENLRNLVLNSFSEDEFEIKIMTYALPDIGKKKLLQWADVAFFAPGRYLPDDILYSARHIKLMQLMSSGFDKFNTDGARKYGIPVANNGGSNAQSVAEHTVLLMLSIYKWLPDSYDRTVNGRWSGNSHGMDMYTLRNKTIGIIGFGNIGRLVARIVNGFGMKILYYDIQRASNGIEDDLNAEFVEQEELYKRSDIITLHLHLNDHTKGMLGRKEFAIMKNTAVFINVSRSQLADKSALLEALNERRIWAAGLDVFEKEPTSANDPLLVHPHVVATPHMAGSTYDAYKASMGNSLENIRRVINGEKPFWIVNGVD